jgi:hypothetical protein
MTATDQPGPSGSGSVNGTGPQLVARLLADATTLTLRGIDFARIDPAWHAPLRRVLAVSGGGSERLDAFVAWCREQPNGEAFQVAVLQELPEGEPPRYKLLTPAEMDAYPAPTWLVEGVLVAGSFAALTGEYDTYKSFTAQSLLLCVATGTPWHGHPVRPGRAVYVCGEGVPGIRNRRKAWEIANGIHADERFRLLPEAVQFRRPADVDDLLRALGGLPEPPDVIGVDTFARSFIGGDENSAQDVGVFIGALDRVRVETGATILLVHHHGRAGTIRGSSALPAALDTWLQTSRNWDLLSIACLKQKDAERFDQLTLERYVIKLPDGGTSLVFRALDYVPKPTLTPTQAAVLALLTGAFGAGGATHSAWAKACLEHGIAERTAKRAFAELQQAHLVWKDGDQRGAHYHVGARPEAAPDGQEDLEADE